MRWAKRLYTKHYKSGPFSVIARGNAPKQSRSRKAEAGFWIAAAAKGRLAMTALRRRGRGFWRLVSALAGKVAGFASIFTRAGVVVEVVFVNPDNGSPAMRFRLAFGGPPCGIAPLFASLVFAGRFVRTSVAGRRFRIRSRLSRRDG